MPWSNQGGGPWGSGGGGKGPWGSGQQPSGPTPPDLEEFLRRSQDKLRTVLPGGSLGGKGLGLIVLAAIAIWLFSGFFRVEPDELGVVLRFGAAVREVIGRSTLQPILTGARQNIETAVHELMQKVLDNYGAGVLITQVQLQKVDPPSQVIDAFRDVQAARADSERAQNEAQSYANKVVPEARGKAAQITQSAEAYREQTVAEAKGATSRFLQVYDEYKKAPDVTRQRMYLETMERLFGGTDKIIVDQGGGVVPYLPLDQLSRRPQTPPQTGGSR